MALSDELTRLASRAQQVEASATALRTQQREWLDARADALRQGFAGLDEFGGQRRHLLVRAARLRLLRSRHRGSAQYCELSADAARTISRPDSVRYP